MQNEYYTHPLDRAFRFQINVTVSAQISSCSCRVKLEMYCSLSDPWSCIDTHVDILSTANTCTIKMTQTQWLQ